MNLKRHTILKLFLLALLCSVVSCNSQEGAATHSSSSKSVSSAPSDDALFNEKAKEGCTTEEDLEKKLEEAAKAETVSLQGTTDPGCEVK